MTKYVELLSAAKRAAAAAAEFIRSANRPPDASWDKKGASDFVTAVDRGAELIIAESLTRDVPGSVVQGEELTPEIESGDPVWVVDPLDGTTNYIHGFPAYAVSIAAVADGLPRAAVVTDVSRGELFHATEGGGAWQDSMKLRVSERNRPEDCLIGTGFPFKHPNLLAPYLRQFTTILGSTSGIRRAGSAALDLAHLACGFFDGFWELALAPWDVAAGTLIVREAGGIVTNLAGSHEVITHGPIVAGNPAVHAWLMETLA